MARLTKEAQETLDGAIVKYKDFIIERATIYASQEDSLDIRGKHVIKAVKDYQNVFIYENKKIIKHRHFRLYTYMMMSLAICILIIFLFLSFKSLEDNYEVVVLVSSILGVIAVAISMVTMLLTYKKARPHKDKSENRQKNIGYLNKWSEMESLLRNLYRKKKHKTPETIKELLDFYQELPIVVERGKQDSIYPLLQARNNLIHRGSIDADVKVISNLNDEIDAIIDILRNSN